MTSQSTDDYRELEHRLADAVEDHGIDEYEISIEPTESDETVIEVRLYDLDSAISVTGNAPDILGVEGVVSLFQSQLTELKSES